MAELKDRWGLISQVPGNWVYLDPCLSWLPECPECGADPDSQCSFCPEGEDYAIEVSSHIHVERYNAMLEEEDL